MDKAIHKALEAFSNAASSNSNKILVVFTDGEDFSSDLALVKEQASQEQLHIFTVGVGTSAGGPIPLFDDQERVRGHQKDVDGSVVISRLNHGILNSLSLDCGGNYIPLSPDNDHDIQTIASYIEQYEKEIIQTQNIHHEQERYYWFAGIAFICLLVEWLL